MTVNIEWVGLACFRVWRDGGPVIVMDPFNPAELMEFGLFPGETSTLEQPDQKRLLDGNTVIVSSMTDIAHSCPKLVRGSPRVINALGLIEQNTTAEIDGSPVIPILGGESPDRPEEFGESKPNAVYSVKVGDLWVTHLGDLGRALSAEELEPFVNHCDVLLALVSGPPLSIPFDNLDFLIDYLKPKWIVPMHYRLPPLEVTVFAPLSVFLDRHRDKPLLYTQSSTVRFPIETDLAQPMIVSLKPSSYEPLEAAN